MKPDKPVAKGEGKGANPLGTHPVGTAVGGVTGAVTAGATIGSVAGPVGTAVGAAMGAVVGGVSGKLIADLIDPQMEEAFWRKTWNEHDYPDHVPGTHTYDRDWAPAFRYGVDAFRRAPHRHIDEMENELSSGWTAARGESKLDWSNARLATQDAWQRARDLAERAVPGDDDGDGR